MSALPPVTQDPAQDPQQAKVRRLKQFIMARAQSLQQDVVDEHGAVLRKGPDRPQAIWQAIVEARRLKGQSKQRGEAMDAYLKGETEEFPDGWIRQPLKPVKAEGGMAEAREASPVQSTMQDWVAGPASKIAGGAGQAIYNMGRGLTNLQREGVLMAAPAPVRGLLDAMIPEVPARDVRTDALAAARMIGTGHLRDAAKLVYMNQDDAAGTRENMKRADAAMHDSAHWAARYLGNVGEFVGEMAGGPGGAAKQLFHAGGKVSALLSAKILEKTGKVAPKIVEGMVGTGAGLAAMEGIAGTDPEGGNPDLAQRAKNAAVGGAIGPLVSLTGDIGKMAFRGILGTGLKSLAPNEKVSVETLKRWAKQNGVLPVRNEPQQDYLNRLVGQYLDAGAPMSKMTWPQIKARAVQAGIEGAGFSMMDVQFRDDLFGGIWDLSRGVIDGDEAMTASALERLGRATDHYLVTAGGTAALRMPLKSIVPWQRRQPSPQSPAGHEPASGGKPPTPESPSPTPIGFDPSFKPEQQAATQRAPEPTQRPRELPAPQQPTPDWGDAMRLGWQPKASPAPVVGAGPKIEAAQRTGVTMALPGTPHEFEVVGEWAIPSPSLRKALGISGEVEPRIPLEVFRQVINDASRIAALQSKGLLPGTEIDASGVKADGGKMRVIRLGQVLESPLSPDVRWVPRLTYTPRQPDQISPQQEEIVYSLSDILGKKMSLTQQDRVILSHVIDVMRDVSAERDASVAEAIAGLNQLGPAIAQGQPEMASDAIRMLSDLLTTKSMEVIAAEQQRAMPERSGEAGALDVGMIADAAVRGAKDVKKIAQGVTDFAFRDQIDSIEKRVGDADRGIVQGMRLMASRRRTKEGEAIATFESGHKAIKKNLSSLMEMVDVDGVQTARWDALLRNKIENPTATEREIGDKLNDVLLGLWRNQIDAGAVMSKTTGTGAAKTTTFFRPTEQDTAKMPRVWGEDYDDVMADPTLRMAWFSHLEAQNPGVVDAAKMEAEHRAKESKSAGKKVSDAEREASFENIRYIQNVDYVWNGKKMLEANPFEAFNRTIQRQAARSAAISVYGQEGVPKAELAKLGLDPTKTGIPDRVALAIDRVVAGKVMRREDVAALAKDINDTMVRLQGSNPETLTPWGEILVRMAQVPKSILTIPAGLYDIPTTFSEGINYGGLRRTFKAVGSVVMNYKDRETAARRAGVLVDRVMHLDAESGSALLKRVADLFSAPGNVTEKLKVVVFDRIVDYALEDFAAGRGSNFDRDVMKQLGFTPQQVSSLMAGTASKDLRQMLRHHMVQAMTNRGHMAERSKFAASRYWTSLIWFGQFATRSLYNKGKFLKSSAKTIAGKQSTVGERTAAMQRLIYLMAGLGVAGAGSQLLMYLFNDMFRGENGAERLADELAHYPGRTVTKMLTGQVFTGPIGTVIQGATEDSTAVNRLIVPVSLVEKGFRAAQRIATGDDIGDTVLDTMTGLGLVPLGRQARDLWHLGNAHWLGANKDRLSDVNSYREWTRIEGIPWKQGFQRHKSSEYYAAMRTIREILNAETVGDMDADDAAEKVVPKIEERLRAVLKLEPEESVAGSIRAMQLVASDLSDEQRDRLLSFWGQERYERVMAHDNMIAALASAVGRDRSGAHSTPFEDSLRMAAGQALAGARNAWGKLATRAIEDAADAITDGRGEGENLRALARRMALHPETLGNDDTLSETEVMAINSGRTALGAEDIIYSKLRRRAVERAFAERKRRAVEAAKSDRVTPDGNR